MKFNKIGSLTNFTMVKALNQYKVLEIGKYKGSDSKNSVEMELRARIKSLT